jgi:leucine dehydrogenase
MGPAAMSIQLLSTLARERFEELVAVTDEESGLRAFIAIHDTSAGPAIGGVRRFEYTSESAALDDCLRLARAMTAKCILADLPAGGGKAVILDGPDLDVERAYRLFGRRVEQLGGAYYTGPDVGTGPRETAWMAAETRFAADPGPAGPGLLSQATAAGTFAGMAVALEHIDGETDWSRRTVVVQGLGQVGFELARRLRECDVRVMGSDLDPEHAARADRELGVEIVECGSEFRIECDVFSPNAMGGVLHDLNLRKLAARCVVGAANNPLASLEHGDRLHADGVLFVPDFVVNSGALVRGTLFHLEGRREPLEQIEARIATATRAIIERSDAEDLPPARVAEREVADRLALRRAARSVTDPLRARTEPADAARSNRVGTPRPTATLEPTSDA